MKKLIFAVLAFAVTVSVFAGGKKDSGGAIDRIKQNGKIRIGIFTDKKPFGYVDERGVNQGYDVYLAHRLAKDLLGDENAIEFVPVVPASRVEFLQSDKVDIILANFTVTPARAEAVDFALPYMKVALGIVSPDSAPIKDISQLSGKELIIIKGTTAETYFAENYPQITLQKYDEISDAFNALKDGRGAALSQDNTLLFAWAVENPGFTTTIESIGSLDTIAPAVRKGNTELRDWINHEIQNNLGDRFFHDAYDAALRPIYGNTVDPESVVVEKGVVR
ncbi:MAG: cysteine ABC transporter substrate-binding protein [Spirochaetaceae bacterium]|jgi:polar amino acid transport system substrate-binding protein|nr:cysteine ABC transporter substrate-binding protein [Spirochaetaceae bacterium]